MATGKRGSTPQPGNETRRMVGSRTAVVFDLDGTLIDSAPDLHVAAARLLAEEGFEDVGLAAIRAMVGEGVPRLVERLYAAVGAPLDDAHVAWGTNRFRALYLERPCRLTVPLPGAREVLAMLGAAGHPLGLCTNKPLRHTEAILVALGLEGHFGVVVGGDSLPARKPDPAPLLLALQRLDRAPDAAVLVGDSAIDYRTARAAGTAVVLVAGGYAQEPLETLAPDAHIPNLGGLPAALEALGVG